VGHALRRGTRAAVDALLEGQEPGQVGAHLDEIVKIRAIQELKPSEAISFVFLLKEALRAELGAKGSDASLSELAELEKRIDLIALSAFDIYTRYRGQIAELRINEIKRSVGWRRAIAGGGCPSRFVEEDGPQLESPGRAEAERGGGL
jgi:hypothetical protein